MTSAPLCTDVGAADTVPILPSPDLYNHLVRYFDNHLKPLQTVGIYVYYCAERLLIQSFSLFVLRRNRTRCKTRLSSSITQRNGTDTLQLHDPSTVSSHISTVTGSRNNGRRAARTYFPYTRYVTRINIS